MNSKTQLTTAKYWKKIFSTFNKSNQTIRKFCSENKISINKFMYWRKKFILNSQQNDANNDEKPAMLQEIKIKPTISSSKEGVIKIILPGGINITIPYDLEHNKLTAILTTLRDMSC